MNIGEKKKAQLKAGDLCFANGKIFEIRSIVSTEEAGKIFFVSPEYAIMENLTKMPSNANYPNIIIKLPENAIEPIVEEVFKLGAPVFSSYPGCGNFRGVVLGHEPLTNRVVCASHKNHKAMREGGGDRVRYAYKYDELDVAPEYIYFKTGKRYVVHNHHTVIVHDDPYNKDKVILYRESREAYVVVDRKSYVQDLINCGIGPIEEA